MKKIFLKIIFIYKKYISIFFPRRCRFYPTCSQYAYDSIVKYGLLVGCWKALVRIFKCHPFHPGGYDPV